MSIENKINFYNKITDIQNDLYYYRDRQKDSVKCYKTLAELSYSLGREDFVLERILKNLQNINDELKNEIKKVNENNK